MEKCIDKQGLLDTLGVWNGFLKKFEDCLLLLKKQPKEIKIDILAARFKETAFYEVAEDKVNKNLEYFLRLAEKK
jgi:hypothetical protein